MKKLHILFLLVFISLTINSQTRLPRLVSNGMVIQRHDTIKIWGWDKPGTSVLLAFKDKIYSTITASDGKWEVKIGPFDAGGPYDMMIKGSSEITISDILIGDVWVCSGQSNMELPMNRVSWVYPEEMNAANYYIRQFIVPKKYNFNNVLSDLESGNWQSVTPSTIANFSALAYFFAKELYKQYQIPIGLINSALGGSPAEAWLSEEALKSFPGYYAEAQRMKDSLLVKSIIDNDQKNSREWYKNLNSQDNGINKWNNPELDISDWKTLTVPGYWNKLEDIGNMSGVVWVRRNFTLPESFNSQESLLVLGRIVDADSVWINGKFVGAVSYQYPPRRYRIPEGVLQAGKNTIVVKVIINNGFSGFVPDKPYGLVIKNDTIPLMGTWYYKIGARVQSAPSTTFIQWKPMGLYNAMIAPISWYRIKGVIWYQGESNAGRPSDYFDLFSTLISDWRSRWNQGNFPFLFVQLPNFMEPAVHPTESNWALLREAQSKALSLPNTGMAVTIDLGEWNDIHPLNKKDVAKRLALLARKVVYNEKNIVASGPTFESYKIKGDTIIVEFTNTGKGLVCKGDKLKSFSIAGNDKRFVWANAKIVGNKVYVWNQEVKNPSYVRYAWADNPADANLYNKEGLPAAPFRTDQ